MAVEAVASVVIQKLTDMLTEESSTNQKVIVDHLEVIEKALQEMRGYFIDAEQKQRTDDEVKEWAEKYLNNLYYVEDTIESFALRIAGQRKSWGFLMKHALILKNFTACKKLSRKMKRIQVRIRQLNLERPVVVEDVSLRSIRSQPNGSLRLGNYLDGSVAETHEEDDEEEEEEEEMQVGTSFADPERVKFYLPANVLQRQTASTDLEAHTEKFPHSTSSTADFRSLSDASLFRDRFGQSKLMYSYSYEEEELDIVGFRNDVRLLVKSLTSSNRACSIVSIVGEMGSGKTTLARAVYGNRKIKENFKSCSAWVTVPKNFDAIDLLLKLLKQVGNSKDQGGLITEQSLQSKLLERLNDKKYLIVLDDVSSSEVWDSLKNAFPANRNGSKIILITCQDHVAMHANSRLHRLKKLSYKSSEDLFLKKAGFEAAPEDPNLRQIILDVCYRLPLNIVLLGSLLSTKRDGDFVEWTQTLSSQANWETVDILSLCYNDLPVSYKLCLLYMSLFPKEFDIPVRRLCRLWQAEGFVKRPEKQEIFLEDVAGEYFDNLVKRSLIQVSKLRSEGSAKKCRLLGVLYDYLSPKALDISLFHVHCKTDACGVEKPFGVRRLVEYTDIKSCHLYPSQLKRLRSYLSFNTQKKDIPAKEVGTLLSNILGNGFRLLRVLDLEGVYKPSLPKNLGDFFHLRYLGLRWTFLDTLPQSVGDLQYLETLDVKHTYINTLPNSIWKLKHLRHLNLNGIHLDMPKHLRGSLPKLLTLWGLSVDHESLVKGGLNKLVCLRELGITFHLTSSDELLDWISQLTALQTLRLRSKDDMGYPSGLSLKSLSGLKQLSHLNMLGHLQKLPDKDDFPQGLKVLTLSVSRLKDDPMPMLGQLPSLTVLRLLANSYLGDKMVCTRGGFRELQVLKLWMLENLEEWELEQGAMEKLKALNIRCCDSLRTIPCRLLQQKTFKELTLTNMRKKFREQVEQRKSCNVSLTVKDYKFTPLPGEKAGDCSD